MKQLCLCEIIKIHMEEKYEAHIIISKHTNQQTLY